MRHKLLSAVLALTLALSLISSASAAEVQRHEVPVTLTVIQTEQRISVTVPAVLPVSVVDGYVVTATNAAIRNTADSGTVRVSAVAVTDGALTVGSFENFPAGAYSTIALSINGCATQGSGPLAITEAAFPPIPADSSLALDYQAKVAAEGNLSQTTAATVVFTITAVE